MLMTTNTSSSVKLLLTNNLLDYAFSKCHTLPDINDLYHFLEGLCVTDDFLFGSQLTDNLGRIYTMVENCYDNMNSQKIDLLTKTLHDQTSNEVKIYRSLFSDPEAGNSSSYLGIVRFTQEMLKLALEANSSGDRNKACSILRSILRYIDKAIQIRHRDGYSSLLCESFIIKCVRAHFL